jgi:hypothetical protein
VRRFTYSSESRDDRGAGAGKYGANEREASERLLEQQGCEGSVEDEAGLQRNRSGWADIRKVEGRICNSQLGGSTVLAKGEL